MGERWDLRTPGFRPESEESSSLLQTAVSVLHSSYLDSASQDSFQYSQAVLVENDVFRSELRAFAQAKEAAGYSQEELEETFAFLLFDNEEEAKEVCQAGLRVNSSSISMLGDPAKGVYISKYADCLHPRPWYHGKSGYIVICKLIKGKVKVISENHTTSYPCPSPGYDCHVAVSGDNVPSKSNHCQAFEQSQYYVYEVSDGSAAERPRHVCPYMVITCQYREPKEMPVLAIENLPELDHKALYCPWRGQLSIQGHLLCDIALRTPYSSTIPAQLPPNLDMNHVMGLSDLKKKLPEAAFGKRNYVENEVCFQGVYLSLYEVEISKKDQYKVDQLVENLKEKDLAIIKYLHDQGVLLLLTSAALARDDEFDPKEPISLLALFLFTSSRSVRLKVEKHDLKDGRGDGDISLKIASVLPGLRCALHKATSSSWDDTVSTSKRIKQHFQEYAKFGQHPQPTSGQTSEDLLSSLPSPSEDERPKPFQKCSEQSFSQLQRYLSDPSSYTLEMSAALGCLADASQSLCCDAETGHQVDSSPAVPLDPFLPNTAGETKVKSETPKSAVRSGQSGEGPTKDVNSTSKLWVQQSRRKSSQAVVTSTRKKWSPLKMQTHPMGDGGRNRRATKKKITFSFPKKPGLTANSSEPMLKLANLQFPHRRKRGAEVLSAEFVHRTESEPLQKGTSAPNHPGVETKRPKMLKDPEMKKAPGAKTTPKLEKKQKEPFSVLPSKVSPQHHEAENQTSEVYPGGAADLRSGPKGNDYESHALNLLADLALGSCIPSFIPRDSGISPVSCSPSSDSAEEQQSHRKLKALCVASDHEYHRVDNLAKGATSPSRASPNQNLPPADKQDLNDLATLPREKKPGIFSKKSLVSPSPAKPHVLPPGETQEATEVNKHCFISAEHSYASQMPEHSKKLTCPRGAPYPGPAPSRNGSRNARAGPLVGKVLPFCHQQNSPHLQRSLEAVATRRRSSLLSSRLKEVFARSHAVTVCGRSVKVTCHWEAEYLFHLDSRYTNDALEKTVIRALHGPWDPAVPDDVEEVKLILHMWVALFYSKPRNLLSSRRKVVEHSNPEKYVSINSSGDLLELSDDGEDCFGLETCPADSRSDLDQIPSSSLDHSTQCKGPFHPEESPADSQTDADGSSGVIDSTVSSSSGELPCGEEEPSSTSCPESISITEYADEGLAGKDWHPKVVPEERVGDVSTITAVEQPKEGLGDSTITPSPSDDVDDVKDPSAVLDRENPSSQASNSSRTPWNDALCGHGEKQKRGWAAGSSPGPREGEEGMEGVGHCTDVEGGSWVTSDGPQGACDSMSSEAPPESPKPDGASGEGRESQDPFGRKEKEEKEVEEGKKEKEDSEYESTVLGAVGVASSESSDANVEHEDSEQEPVTPACPKDFGIPGEDPAPSSAALVSPCPGRSTPLLSDGTETGPQGLPGEMAPNLDTLQGPLEALATPEPGTNGAGLAETTSAADVGSLVCGARPDNVVGSLGPAGETPGDGLEQEDKEEDGLEQEDKEEDGLEQEDKEEDGLEQEDKEEDGLEQEDKEEDGLEQEDKEEDGLEQEDKEEDGLEQEDKEEDGLEQEDKEEDGLEQEDKEEDGLEQEDKEEDGLEQEDKEEDGLEQEDKEEDGLEQEDKDLAPSAERWALAGSTTGLESPSPTLSPDSNSVFLTSLDGAKDPGAAPEDEETVAHIQSPSQSELGGSSCSAQRGGGDFCAELTSLSAGQSNQEGWKKVLVEEEHSSLSPNHTDVLDESCGAGVGQGFAFDCMALAGASEAGESDGVGPSAEKTPRRDKTDTVMMPNPGQEPETFLHHLLESEPSSSGSEGMSATKEHPRPQQSSLSGWSPPAYTGSAPASSPKKDPLPHGGDVDLLLEPVLCQHGEPCEPVGAAVSVAAKVMPRCAEEVKKDTAPHHAELVESSPVDVLVPGDLGSMPPSPRGHKTGLCSAEPDSGLGVHLEVLSPGTSPAPDDARRSSCMDTCPRCASPGGQGANAVGSHEEEPILPEDLERGGSIPAASPASFSSEESLVPPCEPRSACNQGSSTFGGLHNANMEMEEGETPTLPFLILPLHAHGGLSAESLELSGAENTSATLPWAEKLPSKDRHMGLAFEDPYEFSSCGLDQECSGGTAWSLLTARGSYRTRLMDAVDTRTTCDSSSVSSGRSEDWDSLGTEWGWPVGLGEASSRHIPPYVSFRDNQGFTKDYQNFMVTKKYQDRMEKLQPSKRRSHCSGQSHLLRSLMGSWRGFEELTQHTLDMECLRFHYKLKQILKSGKTPFSTSKSIFPKDFSPQVKSEMLPGQEAPVELSPRSRSPLQVTILPSAAWPSGFSWQQPPGWHGEPCVHDSLCGERSRARSQTRGHVAPFHLNKLRCDNELKDSRGGDIAGILDEYAEIHEVMKSRADERSEGEGPVLAHGEATSKWTCPALPRRTGAFEEMITELCSALRFRLRSLAKEACGQAGTFYLVETSEDPFFSKVKTVLRKGGRVEMEPLSFCEAKRPDAERLLVVIRNEDISSHIHHVPCLLKLKHCPSVVFAGVDTPEDITGHTYQELFHSGGFVVSDEQVLETVTLGQLREVVKVLEKLNRSGRWKWLLHYKENKKLRGDSRVDSNAHKKDLVLRWCQGADLIEVLHYHTCDSASSPSSEYVRCLLNLQVQRVGARFAVYLTEKPSARREVLESKGILVVDVSTFLGTVQKAAAPFRRSHW